MSTPEIDHRAIFLDMVEASVRARAIATAFDRDTGVLMRLDGSSFVRAAMEREVAEHLRSVEGISFDQPGLTPEGCAFQSASRSSREWWLVSFPDEGNLTAVHVGDTYLSPQDVWDAMEQFQMELEDDDIGVIGESPQEAVRHVRVA